MNKEQEFKEGISKAEKGLYQEAIKHFDRFVAQAPLQFEGYFNRGTAYSKLNHFEPAFENFSQAISLQPGNANLYAERGVLLFNAKKYKEAMQDFDKALELEPQNPYRYASRAYLKAYIGDARGAVEDYRAAHVLDPDDAIVLNNLGMAEEQLGYKEQAQVRFKKADEIADQGKEFEKPSLDEILEKHRKAEASRKVFSAEQKNLEQVRSPLTRLQIITRVFSSKQMFNEFKDFMKQTLKVKKNTEQ